MKVISTIGNEELSLVHVAESASGEMMEFVESLTPGVKREEKWTLVVSTLYGCPVNCSMCDAGNYYHGRISKEGIFAQIDHMVTKYFPERKIPVKDFRIEFTRMGEPSFNMNVTEVIEEFGLYFDAPGFIPVISTIAPKSADNFFDELLRIKQKKYNKGNFILQFSIHTTDEVKRDKLIPVKKWNFEKIAEYSRIFFKKGDKKIHLVFAASSELPVVPEKLNGLFDPEIFMIKITSMNPTYNVMESNLAAEKGHEEESLMRNLAGKFEQRGYEVILSEVNFEEDLIGSSCGQNIVTHSGKRQKLGQAYPVLGDELEQRLRSQNKT